MYRFIYFEDDTFSKNDLKNEAGAICLWLGKVVMVIQKVSSEIFFLSRVKTFEQIYIIQPQLSIYNISSIFRFLKSRLID